MNSLYGIYCSYVLIEKLQQYCIWLRALARYENIANNVYGNDNRKQNVLLAVTQRPWQIFDKNTQPTRDEWKTK